jgi:uncharacterized membrane protein YjgN (DUF898 family)
MVGNFLIILLTLGIGYSWAKVRLLHFVANHSIIPEGIFPENIETDSLFSDQNKKSFLNLIA